VFDRKVDKADLLKSMRARALCDICRDALLSTASSMSHQQFDAIESIFRIAGESFRSTTNATKPRVFIGSSSEGLSIAAKVQELLTADVTSVVWNQGTVFGLGSSTLESLEKAVLDYDFAIFVFTPDDELHTRGLSKPVARDNVVFELGLFTGKLGRKKSFVLNPGKGAVELPSDLLGITTASYDVGESDLAESLAPPCTRILDAIRFEWTEPV
jgi:predicted nucleotide-binding protein